jgi:hypothetical protein
MVEHMDMLEEPAKASMDNHYFYITYFVSNLLNCFHSVFTPFDATYEKIEDILHQFGSFSQTSKTRIKDVVIIFWIICMRIFEDMKMY